MENQTAHPNQRFFDGIVKWLSTEANIETLDSRLAQARRSFLEDLENKKLFLRFVDSGETPKGVDRSNYSHDGKNGKPVIELYMPRVLSQRLQNEIDEKLFEQEMEYLAGDALGLYANARRVLKAAPGAAPSVA